MQIDRHLYLLIIPIFFLACARTTAPTGGPKDTIPPALVSSSPQQGEIRFNKKRIELTLTEAVALNNAREQIIIAPDINKKYKASAKRNKVVLELDTELQAQTTYSLNFRDAIHDITEKNPAKNLKLAFSTGEYIDSLSVNGRVFDPLTSKNIEGVTVAIYPQDTFSIFKHRPSYLTQTTENGTFTLDNLKPGAYHIYAFLDRNRNLITDSKSESYGFKAQKLELQTNIDSVLIPIVRLDARPLKITSARPYNTYFNIKTAKGIQSYSVRSDSDSVYTTLSEDWLNIKVYNTFSGADSTKITVHIQDSIGQVTDTTLYAKFLAKPSKPEAFNVEISKPFINTANAQLSFTIETDKPIAVTNFDSIVFQPDTINKIKIQESDFSWNKNRTKATVQKVIDRKFLTNPSATATTPPKRGSRPPVLNQLTIGKAALISIERDSSDSSIQPVPIRSPEDYGVLIVHVNNIKDPYLIQIVDKSFNIIRQTANTPRVSFTNLPPAEYQIRLILDYDRNHQWTPGNYYRKTEPEPIRYYRNEKQQQIINLKANWEVGPLLITP